MRINNNLMAMNTHRQLGINSANGAKSIEKLSSGNRINRAGDDAAGLAISEKMRSQVRGLNQASRNGQDGISLIQTAEGALNESQAILQRMRELAVQSANDTNVNADRSAIQNEIDQLGEEINRIATTTEFNTQSLLKGDGGTNITATGAVTAGNLASGADRTTTEAKAVATAIVDFSTVADNDTLVASVNGISLTVTFQTGSASYDAGAAFDVTATGASINGVGEVGYYTNANGRTDGAVDIAAAFQSIINANDTLKGQYTAVADAATGAITIEAVKGGAFEGAAGFTGAFSGTLETGPELAATSATTGATTNAVAASTTIDFTSVNTAAEVTNLVGKGFTINDTAIEFYNSNNGAYKGDAVGIDIKTALSSVVADTDKDLAIVEAIVAKTAEIDGVDLSTVAASGVLTISASEKGLAGNDIAISDGSTTAGDFAATFQIGANESQTMEVEIGDMRAEALGIEGVNISTTTTAQEAITTIDDALAKVSNERAKLGAFQNRLEHTIKNLDTSSENLQASESRIRDVDMAKEMMEFTKNNILQQAAQAMLAQANQAPQGVLQLLR